MGSVLLPEPFFFFFFLPADLELRLALLDVAVLLVDLHDLGERRPLVDVLQELLDGRWVPLGLALDLYPNEEGQPCFPTPWNAPGPLRRARERWQRRVDELITFSFGVLRHQPVIPAAVAFFCVKLRKLTPGAGAVSRSRGRGCCAVSSRRRTLDLAVDEEVDLETVSLVPGAGEQATNSLGHGGGWVRG